MELTNRQKWLRTLKFGLIVIIILIGVIVILKSFVLKPSTNPMFVRETTPTDYIIYAFLILLIAAPLILSKRLMYAKRPLIAFMVPVLIFVVFTLLFARPESGQDYGPAIVFGVILIWSVGLILLVTITYLLHKKFER